MLDWAAGASRLSGPRKGRSKGPGALKNAQKTRRLSKCCYLKVYHSAFVLSTFCPKKRAIPRRSPIRIRRNIKKTRAPLFHCALCPKRRALPFFQGDCREQHRLSGNALPLHNCHTKSGHCPLLLPDSSITRSHFLTAVQCSNAFPRNAKIPIPKPVWGFWCTIRGSNPGHPD